MEHLKIKVIGVLKEREDSAVNANNNNNAAARQLTKLTALDLAGILNCRRRLEWTKEWLKNNQTQFMTKENIQKEIQFRSNESYPLNPFFDITEKQFRYLVTKLGPQISSYEPHRKKKTFSAEERIAITLKYLATGEVHSCRNYCFVASKPVVLKMIADICLNMYVLLKDQFICTPKTDEQWQKISSEFLKKNKLPNCLGNLTMKQIMFYTKSRSRKVTDDFCSNPPLILTALVDGNNNFLYVDVEPTTAKTWDQIYEQSKFKQLIESQQLPIPTAPVIALPNGKVDVEHANSCYFVGHGALPLKPYLLTSVYYVPSSQDPSYCFSRLHHKELNYCAKMDEVNHYQSDAMQMLTNIFPVLSMPLRICEENARKITYGCVALYNFLRKTDKSFYDASERICDIEEEIIEKDGEDDECILLASEEERREQEENRPNVTTYNCFQSLRKQKGETEAGLNMRAWLMQHIAENEHSAV